MWNRKILRGDGGRWGELERGSGDGSGGEDDGEEMRKADGDDKVQDDQAKLASTGSRRADENPCPS